MDRNKFIQRRRKLLLLDVDEKIRNARSIRERCAARQLKMDIIAGYVPPSATSEEEQARLTDEAMKNKRANGLMKGKREFAAFLR